MEVHQDVLSISPPRVQEQAVVLVVPFDVEIHLPVVVATTLHHDSGRLPAVVSGIGDRSWRGRFGVRGERGQVAASVNTPMAKDKVPSTPALLALRAAKVPFEIHQYAYVEKGGTRASAEALGVDEHAVVKTIVLETGDKKPLICLMHGDRQISTKQLARFLGEKTVNPCDPTVAQRHTAYQVGGTSPFGTRKALPVYVERTILSLERIYINGGGRGLLVSIAPEVLVRLLGATPVDVATDA